VRVDQSTVHTSISESNSRSVSERLLKSSGRQLNWLSKQKSKKRKSRRLSNNPPSENLSNATLIGSREQHSIDSNVRNPPQRRRILSPSRSAARSPSFPSQNNPPMKNQEVNDNFDVRSSEPEEKLERLKNNSEVHEDYTKDLIKKIFRTDSDISATICKVSLICPAGKVRMNYPCRSNSCKPPHIQTFDAQIFLQMNHNKEKWFCPVCNQSVKFSSLKLDGYFSQIIRSNISRNTKEIVLNKDGSWDPVLPTQNDVLTIDEVEEKDDILNDNVFLSESTKSVADDGSELKIVVKASKNGIALNEQDFHAIEVDIVDRYVDSNADYECEMKYLGVREGRIHISCNNTHTFYLLQHNVKHVQVPDKRIKAVKRKYKYKIVPNPNLFRYYKAKIPIRFFRDEDRLVVLVKKFNQSLNSPRSTYINVVQGCEDITNENINGYFYPIFEIEKDTDVNDTIKLGASNIKISELKREKVQFKRKIVNENKNAVIHLT